MSTGDFEQIYGSKKHKGGWNSIVTCYFIDTAPVILKYISIIHHLLEDGGYWINQGPLLYHWVSNSENSQDERYSQSIEVIFLFIIIIINFFLIIYMHFSYPMKKSKMLLLILDLNLFMKSGFKLIMPVPQIL